MLIYLFNIFFITHHTFVDEITIFMMILTNVTFLIYTFIYSLKQQVKLPLSAYKYRTCLSAFNVFK